MQRDSLRDLLVLSSSDRWQDRAAAASALAPLIDSDVAAQALIDLLRDAYDTGVGQAALEALLDRGDERAMLILFEGVGLADDEMAEHLLYFLARDHWDKPVRLQLVSSATKALTEASGPIHEGAAEVLEALGGNADGHIRS